MVGAFLGLFVDGADTRTPAHYHGVIAAIMLAIYSSNAVLLTALYLHRRGPAPTPAPVDRYPLITQNDTPRIHVQMISSSDSPIGGMGEPVIGVVPAAVANAVYAASGRRLRELPLRP